MGWTNMETAERLEHYYNFSPEVVDTVAAAAEWQAQFGTHGDLFRAVGIQGTERVHYDGYKPLEVVDIRPDEFDSKEAMMIHLAMGNPLDPNNLYQIATIAAANPNTRILASGNPSGFGFSNGKLTGRERRSVAAGNFAPINESLAKYAESQKIEKIDQVGYSYGADKAMGAAVLEAYDVPHAVAIEPASVVKRGLIKLSSDFGSTEKALKGYVEASGLPTFLGAREESVGKYNYILGLARLSNLAIARGLGDGAFQMRTMEALLKNPDMKTTVAWGTASELAVHEAISRQMNELQEEFGSDRVQLIELKDQKHALANDVHLQAALVNQALRG